MATHRNEEGFTLIELMVVVLIIAILMAIAIPTFFGARENAQRRAAQSNVRNAFTNEAIFYADHAEYSEDTTTLQSQDSALTYTTDLSGLTAPRTVYVDVQSTQRASDTVYLAARTPAGECFWIRTVGNEGLPRFAKDDCSGTSLVFAERW
jgi:type IV pilus assembly protein PilA